VESRAIKSGFTIEETASLIQSTNLPHCEDTESRHPRLSSRTAALTAQALSNHQDNPPRHPHGTSRNHLRGYCPLSLTHLSLTRRKTLSIKRVLTRSLLRTSVSSPKSNNLLINREASPGPVKKIVAAPLEASASLNAASLNGASWNKEREALPEPGVRWSKCIVSEGEEKEKCKRSAELLVEG